jgi:hypothetical protein
VHLFKYFLLLFLILTADVLLGQDAPSPRRGSRVIDDTTRQVYGPNTSKYYYEEDDFYNRPVINPIDTLIRNFHRWNFVQRNNNLYQDLGNIGTAIRPIFYQAPSTIGVRSGFDAYDTYWNSHVIRYFDTKSPYSNMNVILGGRGRSLTKGTFSRNINPRWNFGLTYAGQFIDKQIPIRRGKGDRITRSNYYDFYTAYHTKDSIYRIFANFQRMYHRVQEPGGARLDPTDTFQDYFEDDIKVWLSAAESNDLRTNFHFSHHLKAGKALQFYHTLDRYKQRVKYLDILSREQPGFFKDTTSARHFNDSTRDVSKYKVVRNEVGIKGNILKLFYNGYYAIRHYTNTINHWKDDSIQFLSLGDESYLGGRMELRLDSIGLINGWAEVNQDGNYRIEGKILSRWFDATAKQMLYKPSFADLVYFGRHNYWQNNFQNIESSQLNGNIHYRSKVLNLSPGVTFTRLRNYIFFTDTLLNDAMHETHVAPLQSGGNQIMFQPELKMSVTFFRHVTLSGQVIHTTMLENSNDAIQVPKLFVNTQLAYSNIHFNGNFDIHTGVDLHWRSAYNALAYDPVIRQFYNQDNFLVNAFPLVDVFLNAKIKRGRVFVKYHNLVQAFTKQGYIITPYYPGQRNVVDFGFDWSFYD